MISRCTIFQNNTVTNNGNFTTPADSTTASVPWGNGFVLLGTYADLLDSNTITNNPSAGILGVENPDPYPPTTQTVFFQLSGNQITNNTFSGNGTNPDPSAADIVLVGGTFGSQQSTNNCASGNTLHEVRSRRTSRACGTAATRRRRTPGPRGSPTSSTCRPRRGARVRAAASAAGAADDARIRAAGCRAIRCAGGREGHA